MRKEDVAQFYLKYRLFIFPAIVAISSLILIIFVIYPQIVSLLTNQKKTSELLDRSKILEAKAQTLESINPEDLSKKVDLSLASYPDNTDFGTVIGLVQNLTSESGFNATSITIGTSASKQASSQSYSIVVGIIGPKDLFNTLILNIESSTRLIRISGIEVVNSTNEQSVSANLSLDVLYAPVPTSFGNTDTPVPELTESDQELLAALEKNTSLAPAVSAGSVILPPRGKANPFE